MLDLETLSITAAILSIGIAMFAIWLSITFYFKSKESEQEASKSLAKIETQAGILQKLNADQLDKLLDHALKQKQSITEQAMPHVMEALSDITQVIQQNQTGDKDQPITNEQAYELFIALYFYIAQTNYWAQFYIPDFKDFKPDSNDSHFLYKNIVDTSFHDFNTIEKMLDNCDQEILAKASNANLLTETNSNWKKFVTDTTGYLTRNKR